MIASGSPKGDICSINTYGSSEAIWRGVQRDELDEGTGDVQGCLAKAVRLNRTRQRSTSEAVDTEWSQRMSDSRDCAMLISEG